MKQRASQVAEELRKIVTTILLEEVNDPRMGFITVTHIEVTDDLKYGKIFYSVLGTEEQKMSTQEALKENLPYIRRQIVEGINLKFAMDIRFEEDRSIDRSFEIDKIIRKIHKPEEE